MPRKKNLKIPARPVGRPSGYQGDKTLDAISFYIDNFHKDPFNEQVPTIASLASFLHIGKGTLSIWCKQENREELQALLAILLQKQEVMLVNSGLTGEFNSAIAKLCLFKHNYSERVEAIGAFAGGLGGEGSTINVTFVNASENPLIQASEGYTIEQGTSEHKGISDTLLND